MRAAVINVKVADLPRVKATLDEARRRLREQEDTIQRLIDQAAEHGRRVVDLLEQLAGARREAQDDYARAEQAEAALVACRAEVERLKADLRIANEATLVLTSRAADAQRQFRVDL